MALYGLQLCPVDERKSDPTKLGHEMTLAFAAGGLRGCGQAQAHTSSKAHWFDRVANAVAIGGGGVKEERKVHHLQSVTSCDKSTLGPLAHDLRVELNLLHVDGWQSCVRCGSDQLSRISTHDPHRAPKMTHTLRKQAPTIAVHGTRSVSLRVRPKVSITTGL